MSFKLRIVKDYPEENLKIGQSVEAFGHSWLARLDSATGELTSSDLLFFLVWIPARGWRMLQACYVIPIDQISAPLCDQALVGRFDNGRRIKS